MTPRERLLIFVTTAAAGVGAVMWGTVRLAAARAAARDNAEVLAECSRLAARIQSQRGGGAGQAFAAGREPASQELVKRIELGAKTAGLTDASIESIEPGGAQPIENSPFAQLPTTVQFQGVTLQQVFTFLHAVGAGKSGLKLKDITLATPQANEAGDRWSVETTLTCIVRQAPQAGEID